MSRTFLFKPQTLFQFWSSKIFLAFANVLNHNWNSNNIPRY